MTALRELREKVAAGSGPATGRGDVVMAYYRKKPIVIEAIQWTGGNLREVLNFTGKHPKWDKWFSSFESYERYVQADGCIFKILTLEDTMEASPGDWIIRGVGGEHYPCKPDIFAATYEAVDAQREEETP